MIWRIFVCSSVATFTLGTLKSLSDGDYSYSITNSAILKLGTFSDVELDASDIPGVTLVAVICGLLGSLFIYINGKINAGRKAMNQSNFQKIFEVAFLAAMTISILYYVSLDST
jgi:H+/Cl- antiporter ClcA